MNGIFKDPLQANWKPPAPGLAQTFKVNCVAEIPLTHHQLTFDVVWAVAVMVNSSALGARSKPWATVVEVEPDAIVPKPAFSARFPPGKIGLPVGLLLSRKAYLYVETRLTAMQGFVASAVVVPVGVNGNGVSNVIAPVALLIVFT